MSRDFARRPRRGGEARSGPSDDRVNAPTTMILRVHYREGVLEKASPFELFSRVTFIPGGLRIVVSSSLMLLVSFLSWRTTLRDFEVLRRWVSGPRSAKTMSGRLTQFKSTNTVSRVELRCRLDLFSSEYVSPPTSVGIETSCVDCRSLGGPRPKRRSVCSSSRLGDDDSAHRPLREWEE
ncbi:hypothetical protein GW17_00013669 [Ensete ventricosum]|nr:hypothetical protein GW17_00013669 [Ensete ventricosum]RZS09144.1 hypothetical protein BHM03_00040197 [Ensete ventricosum]